MSYISIPTDEKAGASAKNVLKFLAETAGEKLVTGQHTQTLAMEELHHIKKITGKEPALLGFELLSYSPNINYLDTDEECMKEVEENRGTLQRAWEWADKKGLITFTWHWFSPLYGRSKSFFSEHTGFDADLASMPGTPENKALISDMDVMAGILRPFSEQDIPILWRPFHEADGIWFWWGRKGADAVKKLWRMMYDRFVNVHGLHNLLWVWNAPKKEYYPGDDVVDIISRDMYPEKHLHSGHNREFEELTKITDANKVVLIGEIGTLPDPEAIHERHIGWASYMTWSKVFCLTEEFNSFEQLKKVYDSPYVITKENLPKLY
ncbi:MAG: glycoside hydrolase family 26 protein [Lachnospiraceae bacterium]|nr:glycoside hydrolase family 26 protein [Lachnospiraceae bacterium]